MKKYYRWNDGTGFIYADKDDLNRELVQFQALLTNYLEIEDDIDDNTYVARGNGFCDAKYSEDFLEGQIEKIQNRIAQLQVWINECNQNEN